MIGIKQWPVLMVSACPKGSRSGEAPPPGWTRGGADILLEGSKRSMPTRIVRQPFGQIVSQPRESLNCLQMFNPARVFGEVRDRTVCPPDEEALDPLPPPFPWPCLLTWTPGEACGRMVMFRIGEAWPLNLDLPADVLGAAVYPVAGLSVDCGLAKVRKRFRLSCQR